MTKHKSNVIKGQNGTQLPIGTYRTDFIGIDQISVPLCIEIDNEIKTLNPSAKLSADNYDYINKVNWFAEYSDNRTINEINDGISLSSESIDHRRIRKFGLKDADGKVVVILNIRIGHYFFYRKRTVMVTGENVVEVIHLFGWRSSTDRDDPEYSENVCMFYESDMRLEVGFFILEGNGGEEGEFWNYEPKWRNIDNIMTT